MKIFLSFLILFLFSSNLWSAKNSHKEMPKHKWSFNGISGTFDKAALKRGYQVYREVCSGCHSLKLLYYRDLLDIGFSKSRTSKDKLTA